MQNSSPILRWKFLSRKGAKFIANFSATMVTSLPSHSLSLSLSLSVSLSPSAPHAQYRKRFRASYNSQFHGVLSSFGAFFSSNSPIILPSSANRRKRKFIESKTQKCRALACLAIVISDIFCAEFDGLIFQFSFLYPIYHNSRYALDIVIFWMSFWGFDFDFCQSYYNTR